MAKVYIVTCGEYSDYSIHSVFSSREAAEKCCATWGQKDRLWDKPRIEEYELEDGSNIDVKQTYKVISFNMCYAYGLDKIRVNFDMMYDIKPFEKKINRKEKTRMRDGETIELYYGTLPVNKTVETEAEAEKIVFDRLAKWKAEQMGL